MQKVVSVETMRKSDTYTIKNGVDSKELMYRAGKAVFESFKWEGRVAIACGGGNNAGDGYVLALLLKQNNIDCRLFLLSERFSEDGKYYYNKCLEAGIFSEKCNYETTFIGFDIIVDCIFGTGFKGMLKGIEAQIIDKINGSGCKVVSVDINSGLDGDNGLTEKCVKSDLTVSIGYYKTGHFLNMAKDNIKALCNHNIGIELSGECTYLVESEDFLPVLTERTNYSYKGSYGFVTIFGGCINYSGAVKLANLAASALRAGCGVVRLAVPESIASGISLFLLESTLHVIDDNEGYMKFVPEKIDEALQGSIAAAIGMGWGQEGENEDILRYILGKYDIPLIIDADGINTFSKMDLEILKTTKCRVTITPHVKEFSRLIGIGTMEIIANPVYYTEKFAKEYNVVVLLKGTSSIISDGKITFISNRGCAGMATAGSGDVLVGIILGIYGYNKHHSLNSACGAYIAGLAGEMAEDEMGSIGMIASDTVRHIPVAIKKIAGHRKDSVYKSISNGIIE